MLGPTPYRYPTPPSKRNLSLPLHTPTTVSVVRFSLSFFFKAIHRIRRNTPAVNMEKTLTSLQISFDGLRRERVWFDVSGNNWLFPRGPVFCPRLKEFWNPVGLWDWLTLFVELQTFLFGEVPIKKWRCSSHPTMTLINICEVLIAALLFLVGYPFLERACRLLYLLHNRRFNRLPELSER